MWFMCASSNPKVAMCLNNYVCQTSMNDNLDAHIPPCACLCMSSPIVQTQLKIDVYIYIEIENKPTT